MANALLEITAFTIDFDNELPGMGYEIGNVVAHGALPPEAETFETMGLQMAPGQSLRASHRASKLLGTGALDIVHWSVRHTPLPPLPRKPDSCAHFTKDHG